MGHQADPRREELDEPVDHAQVAEAAGTLLHVGLEAVGRIAEFLVARVS